MAEYQLWARNKRVLRENTWQHVDFVKAPTKNEAIVKWKRENPDKNHALEERDERIVALVFAGGI
tara:strand:- start:255 stop:449 length:195 start_codon:yes stop_codon:yes gene_type:complete